MSNASSRGLWLESVAGQWAAGLGLGVRVLPAAPMLGLKRLLLPVSYWRTAEFRYACRQMRLPPGTRILDLGSPKDITCFLAKHRGFEVVATDILTETVELNRRVSRAAGLDGTGGGKIQNLVQDGRKLEFADNSFDAAVSISVIEHIPDRGDSAAMAELVRVTRPGGKIVVTTPCRYQYEEIFVSGPVYERKQAAAEPVFFERHYDDETLRERLLSVPGTRVTDLQFWGEGRVRLEHFMSRFPRLRTVASPLEPMMSGLFLKRLHEGQPNRMAAFFTLEKC